MKRHTDFQPSSQKTKLRQRFSFRQTRSRHQSVGQVYLNLLPCSKLPTYNGEIEIFERVIFISSEVMRFLSTNEIMIGNTLRVK